MDRTAVLAQLAHKIKEDEKNTMYIQINDDIAISVTTFSEMFQESELTFSSLSENERTNESWLEVFREWNKQGILPD